MTLPGAGRGGGSWWGRRPRAHCYFFFFFLSFFFFAMGSPPIGLDISVNGPLTESTSP
jgi:hypothetical protein